MIAIKQKKRSQLDKKRKKLSLLAKLLFDNMDISKQKLQIKFIAHPQLVLSTFNYYRIEGDFVFCDRSDDGNYNISTFLYPFTIKPVQSIEFHRLSDNTISLITINISNYPDKIDSQILPLSVGIDRLRMSLDPNARKAAYFISQIDFKMNCVYTEINNLEQIDTAKCLLESYHLKLDNKAEKIAATHPFYIVCLAKAKSIGNDQDKLQLKKIQISPKLLDLLQIDLEKGTQLALNNQLPYFFVFKFILSIIYKGLQALF